MNDIHASKGINLTAVTVALLLAAGIAAAGYFVSKTLFNAKVAVNTAQAKGLAERTVTADMATWRVHFSVSGSSREEIPALYQQAEAQQAQIIELLKAQGFTDEEIHKDVIGRSVREFRDENQILVEEIHRLSSTISISTQKVEIVHKAREELNKLVALGIEIDNNRPDFFFTRINDIKPAMLKEAAQNARIAATEFAENAGAKVGKIRSASQGGFIVQDAGASAGDTGNLLKDVRVVTTIDFYLVD